MDVTLVLTHRCNLDCLYCYAGEHVRRDMDAAVLERSLDLLFADGARRAQLSFFGGEPFLAFDAMQRAVAGAQRRAEAAGGELVLQCTTNGTLLGRPQIDFVRRTGLRCTVSIDGVREAHELTRPRAGGGTSFDQVVGGLRALVAAGARPDAMMVITPATAEHAYRSVSWLWDEGAQTVRANLDLGAEWSAGARAELREQLVSIGWEQLARRVRGERIRFQPFEAGARRTAPAGTSCGREVAPRAQVAVATTGHLYPCAPMVGEDRDRGPEAALRLGHLDDGAAAVAERVACDGAGCDTGKACACAAWLETGNRAVGGAVGRWYALVCAEIGAAVATAERDLRGRTPVAPARQIGRRPLLVGLIASGGLALGGAGLMRAAFSGGEAAGTGVLGNVIRAPAPPIEPMPPPPGGMEAPPPPPPPPAPPTEIVRGEMAVPPQAPPVAVKGDIAAPPPQPEVDVDGDIGEPPPPPQQPQVKTQGDLY